VLSAEGGGSEVRTPKVHNGTKMLIAIRALARGNERSQKNQLRVTEKEGGGGEGKTKDDAVEGGVKKTGVGKDVEGMPGCDRGREGETFQTENNSTMGKSPRGQKPPRTPSWDGEYWL